jgi:hypothetical protein
MLRAARGWIACLEILDRASEYEAAQALGRSLPCQRQNASAGVHNLQSSSAQMDGPARRIMIDLNL